MLSAAVETCGFPTSLCCKLPGTQLKFGRRKLHQQAGADVVVTHAHISTAWVPSSRQQSIEQGALVIWRYVLKQLLHVEALKCELPCEAIAITRHAGV